jgi:LysM repeat protein
MWGSAPDDDGDFTTDDGVDDVPVVPPRAVPPDAGPSSSGGSGQPQDAASRGLAGSAAYRLAGPDPDEPPPATPQREGDPGEWPSRGAAAAAGTAAASASPVNADQRGSSGRAADGAPAPRSDASELFGPAWEAPRRYEAYPTLRTRVGLPSFAGVPRVAIAAGGLILAAVLVFAFGPGLLGFGKSDQPGGGAAPTPTATASASETPEPTVAPTPTPTVYIVAKGDTFSKIAKKLGVTVEVLKAANPQIKNIDKIQIGDQVNIPQAVENGGDGSAEP